MYAGHAGQDGRIASSWSQIMQWANPYDPAAFLNSPASGQSGHNPERIHSFFKITWCFSSLSGEIFTLNNSVKVI